MPSLMHELGIDKITPEQRWQLLDELEESFDEWRVNAAHDGSSAR